MHRTENHESETEKVCHEPAENRRQRESYLKQTSIQLVPGKEFEVVGIRRSWYWVHGSQFGGAQMWQQL